MTTSALLCDIEAAACEFMAGSRRTAGVSSLRRPSRAISAAAIAIGPAPGMIERTGGRRIIDGTGF